MPLLLVELVKDKEGGKEANHTEHPHDQEGDDDVGNVVLKSTWHHPVDVAGEDSIGDEEGDKEGDLFPRLRGDEEHQAVHCKDQNHGSQNAEDVEGVLAF